MEHPFKHNFTKEVELVKPFSKDIAKRCLTSPYFFELLYHGIIKFYKAYDKKTGNKKSFLKDEFLNKGDIYYGHQPDFEKGQMNKYKIVECDFDLDSPNGKSFMAVEVIEFTPQSAFTRSRMNFIYDLNNGKPKMSMGFAGDTSNPSNVNLMKSLFDMALKRMQKLAADPEESLKILSLISSSDFIYANKANFYKLPYSLETELIINTDVNNATKTIGKTSCLNNFFPNIVQVNTKDNKVIQVGDEVFFTFNNLKFHGLKMQIEDEKIRLTVKNCDNNLLLLSDEKVGNFHQIGFQISLSQYMENITKIKIGIYYHKSNLIGFAEGFQKITSFFTSKLPDPKILLYLRARSLLDTCLSHLYDYIKQELAIELISIKQEDVAINKYQLSNN